MHYELL